MRMQAGGPVPNLDFLRACAVLFVLVDHTLNSLGLHFIGTADLNWLGRTGVLFFFVHTCCVLAMSLERHQGEGFFSSFYSRRIFRIYPLSIVAVLLVAIFPHAPPLSRMEWLSNLALIQNLTFSRDAYGTIWSLPLEVQMYCFIPFIFRFQRLFRSIWPLVLLIAFSIPLALWVPHHVARASVLAFVPAFLPGFIAYALFRRDVQRLPAWGLPILVAGITIGLLMHPGWHAPAWIACLALGSLIPLFRQIANPAVNAITFQIAKYSYGIYLSHSLLLIWMPPSWKTLPIFLLAVAAVSIASYHLIEYPMIKLGQRLTIKRRIATEPMAAHAERTAS